MAPGPALTTRAESISVKIPYLDLNLQPVLLSMPWQTCGCSIDDTYLKGLVLEGSDPFYPAVMELDSRVPSKYLIDIGLGNYQCLSWSGINELIGFLPGSRIPPEMIAFNPSSMERLV